MAEKANPFNKSEKAPITAPIAAVSDKEEPKDAINEDTELLKASSPSETKETTTYENDEVLPLLDMILNDGYAIEEFSLRNTSIIIRTRFTWEEKAIFKHLEDCDIKTALNYQREFAFITMAASIVKVGNTVFHPINTGTPEALAESMKARYDFISSLNSVLADIIQAKLNKFDSKQRYIIDNFDKLLQAF